MSRVFSPLVFCILALALNHVYGTNQHMICKTVEDVFTDGGLNQGSIRPRTLQGPQGKKGPPGVKGEVGLPGSVDPQMIENIVEEKVNAASRVMQERLEILERQVAELNTTTITSPVEVTTTPSPDVTCDEGIVYRRKCYYAILRDTQNIILSTANELCRESGGIAADILNLEHQVLVENYIRRKASSSYTVLWLGMTYAYSSKTLRWSNGTSTSLSSFRWHGGYPHTNTHVAISVDGTASGKGLFDYSSNGNLHGSVCEK